LAAQLRPQHARDAAPQVDTTARAPQPRSVHALPVHALPNAAELYRALAATQRRLGAALRQIDTLVIQDSLLKQEVALAQEAAAKARRFAYHDELTGLPNRRLLLDQFAQAVARGARRHGQVAVLLLDLDGFKSINDALGHAAGDALLRQVATRLVGCVRASDTACRLGGDEFLILLPELEDAESAVAAAEKIRAHLAIPFVINGAAIKITTSIGIAIYPVDGEEYGELIRRADHAMYRNKARGPAPPSIDIDDDVRTIPATRVSVAPLAVG
jgi:diguanylate cyclase (GGDEF)-like protein